MLGRICIAVAAGAALTAIGCFVDVPDINTPGAFQCSGPDDCASGFSCGQDGFCFKPGSTTDACANNPCLNNYPAPICQPDPGSGYHCIASCDQSACPTGMSCVHVTTTALECRPDCDNGKPEGAICSSPFGSGVCAKVLDKSHTTDMLCVPCDPVAQAGGCGGAGVCSAKPGPNEYYQSLECVGALCSDNGPCTTPPYTACIGSHCRHPCAVSPYPCADFLGCDPTPLDAQRYMCAACDPSQQIYCGDGLFCVSDTPTNTCAPSCATASSCPSAPGSPACVAMNTLGNGSQNVCAYCPVVCGTSQTCAASGSNAWSAAATCQGGGTNHPPVALASCNSADAYGCKIQHGSSLPGVGSAGVFKLDGSGSSDPDTGDTLTYNWSQLYSVGDVSSQCQPGFAYQPSITPNATLEPAAATTQVTAPMAVGLMVFALKVTDSVGASSINCVAVESTDNPPIPLVDFSQTLTSVTTTSGTASFNLFAASATMTDADSVDVSYLTYTWTNDTPALGTVTFIAAQDNGRHENASINGVSGNVTITFRVSVWDGFITTDCPSATNCGTGSCCVNIEFIH